MKTLFPKVLEAAFVTEKSFWKIGDALLEEADETTSGRRGLQAVSDELAQHGIEYSPQRLGQLRSIAAAFPRSRRNHAVPFRAYEKAQNPDALDAVMRVAKKAGERVTSDYVRDALSEMHEQAAEAKRKAREEAEREQEEAREAQQKARRAKEKARNQDEEDRARREEREADKRRQEADDKLRRAKVAPKKAFVAAPADDDIPLVQLATTLKANADRALELAIRNKKMLGRNAADLSPRAIAGLTETALEIANAWREFADEVRSASKNKRGHLSVVNE